MTKVYNSKSNAIRAFKTHYPDTAASLSNAEIATDWLDEDEGGWMLIDPAVVAEEEQKQQAALEVHVDELPKSGRDGKCPHCGNWTANGLYVTDFAEMAPASQRSTEHQFTCNECAGEWGPAVEKETKARVVKTNKTGRVLSTIDTPVARMWNMLDNEPHLARKVAVARGIAMGVSPNTAATQFQWWRKARGLVKAKA